MIPLDWLSIRDTILHSMPIGQPLMLTEIAVKNGMSINRCRRFMDELTLGQAAPVEGQPKQIGNYIRTVYTRKK